MKKRLSVAFYMTTILEHSGGFEQYLIRTAREMTDRYNIEIEIITLDETFMRRLGIAMQILGLGKHNEANMKKIDESEISQRLGAARYIKCSTVSELSIAFKRHDLIYAKNELLDAVILGIAAHGSNLPPIIYCCGTPLFYPDKSLKSRVRNFIYTGRIYRFLTNNAAAFHVKNLTDFNILSSKKRALVPNSLEHGFVNVTRIPIALQEIKSSKKNGESSRNKLRIIWVGRLTTQKGTKTLEYVIASVNGKLPHDSLEWIVIGSGEDEERMKSALINESNVAFTGQLSREQVLDKLVNSDLFISTSKWESFGQNVLEAQGADLPVISFNIPGPNEIIQDQKTGILVDTQEQMVDEVINFYNGKYAFTDIAKTIRERYSPEFIYSTLFDLFNSVARTSTINT